MYSNQPLGKTPAPIERKRITNEYYRPLLVAHRCGSGLGPENTCGAVVQSSFYIPDYFEIDIRHTLDGVPVCFHDENLLRTGRFYDSQKGDWITREDKISDLSLDELMKADAGIFFDNVFKNEKIPTLEKMLDCVNPSPLAIELKEKDISEDQCRKIAELLKAKKDISSLILSFFPEVLERYGKVDPDRRECYLATDIDEYSKTGGHEIVGLLSTNCTLEKVDELHKAGKKVFVWTVNDDFEKYAKIGVDAIVTDRPDLMRSALPPT